MIPVPKTGDDVHYVSHGSPVRPDGTQAYAPQCRAAKVSEVDGDDPTTVGLVVFNPSGLFFLPVTSGGVDRDQLPPWDRICVGERAVHKGGTWHWPCGR
jgi:hypothetical protein